MKKTCYIVTILQPLLNFNHRINYENLTQKHFRIMKMKILPMVIRSLEILLNTLPREVQQVHFLKITPETIRMTIAKSQSYW